MKRLSTYKYDNFGGTKFNQNALNRLTMTQTGTPTGYLDKDGGVHSFVKDYQGNVRQVMSESGAVEQESHYYPYGMLMGESDVNGSRATANRYRYGGKEYLPSSGLNLYDFSARYLDPAGCGFLSSDPVLDNSHSMSQFAFCNANPVMFIDPTGESAEVEYTKDGTAIVSSKLYFYGTYANEELSRKIADGIACNWNAANATIVHEGKEYKVKFRITYETVSEEKAIELAKNNTSAKNNFVRIEKGENQSFTFSDHDLNGANSMWLDISDDLANSKTPSHEFGHLLGLEHPYLDLSESLEKPSIMIGRNTKYGPNWSIYTSEHVRVVNPNSRIVTGQDVQKAAFYRWGQGIVKSKRFNYIIPKNPFK